MTVQHAYSTDNTETVAAYVAACEAQREAGLRAVKAAEVLGKNKGPCVVRGIWGVPDAIVGLFPDDPEDVPEGWAYIKKRDRLEPKRYAVGEPARQWLKDHQLSADPRVELGKQGLPHNARKERPGDFGFWVTKPQIFVHDGVLWARYEGEVDGECTWTSRRLSEFHAALEAYEDDATVPV